MTDTPEQIDVQPTEEEVLGDIWEKHQAEGVEEPLNEAPEAEEAPVDGDGVQRDEKGRFVAKEADQEADEPSEGVEPEAEPEEAEVAEPDMPSHLPREIRDKWADIPEDVRPLISDAHMRMAQKVSDASRMNEAIRPIYDTVWTLRRSFLSCKP